MFGERRWRILLIDTACHILVEVSGSQTLVCRCSGGLDVFDLRHSMSGVGIVDGKQMGLSNVLG